MTSYLPATELEYRTHARGLVGRSDLLEAKIDRAVGVSHGALLLVEAAL